MANRVRTSRSALRSFPPTALTWTFRLKQGLRYAPPFEDTPIVAPDVVRALERTARVTSAEEMIGYPFYYSAIRGFDAFDAGQADSIAGLETPDDRTLVVRLEEATGDLAYRFAMPATAPIPEGADEGHDEDYGRFLVASGPYMIEGSEELDFSTPPDEQEPAAGFVPAVLTRTLVAEEPGSLVLVRNPILGPGHRPASRRLRGSDRVHDRRPRGRDRASVSTRPSWTWCSDRTLAVRAGRRVSGRPGAGRSGVRASGERLLVGDHEPRRSAVRRRPRPPCGGSRDRQGGTRRVALRAALRSVRCQLGRGRDAHGADAFEGGLLRASTRTLTTPRRPGRRCERPPTTGQATAGATRAHVGTSKRWSWMRRDPRAGAGDPRRPGRVGNRARPGSRRRWLLRGRSLQSHPRPGDQISMGIAYPWGQDYPDGGGWFSPLFDRSGRGGWWNTSLLGATPASSESGGTGSPRSRASTTDSTLVSRVEAWPGPQCWAELDQYLTTEVVSTGPVHVHRTGAGRLGAGRRVLVRSVPRACPRWTGSPSPPAPS